MKEGKDNKRFADELQGCWDILKINTSLHKIVSSWLMSLLSALECFGFQSHTDSASWPLTEEKKPSTWSHVFL